MPITNINRLTDDTGIIQHAKFGIPNLKEGYTLDDNARALLMVAMAYRQKKDVFSIELAPIYLSYIYYMQNGDGTFRNFQCRMDDPKKMRHWYKGVGPLLFNSDLLI